MHQQQHHRVERKVIMWRKFRPVFYAPLVLGLLLVLSSFSMAKADDWLTDWEKFDFAKNSIQASQLEGRSLDDLKMLRGIIFGRHGRVFKDPDIKKYLAERPWFKPNPNFQNSMLNKIERQNLDIIREAESKQHEFIQPGDLRFYVDRVIKTEELGEHSGGE